MEHSLERPTTRGIFPAELLFAVIVVVVERQGIIGESEIVVAVAVEEENLLLQTWFG